MSEIEDRLRLEVVSVPQRQDELPACPTCGVPAGQRCVDATWEQAYFRAPHPERLALFTGDKTNPEGEAMTNTTDTQRLREIQERVEKATPGPWSREKPPYVDGWPQGSVIGGTVGKQTIYTHHTGGTYPSADANLIANAPADLKWLLEQLAALTREKAESVVTDEAITAEARKIFPDTEPPALAEAFRETFMGGAKYVRAALSAGQAESDTKP